MADGKEDGYKPLRDADGLAAISRALREAAAAQAGDAGGRQQDERRKSVPLPPVKQVASPEAPAPKKRKSEKHEPAVPAAADDDDNEEEVPAAAADSPVERKKKKKAKKALAAAAAEAEEAEAEDEEGGATEPEAPAPKKEKREKKKARSKPRERRASLSPISRRRRPAEPEDAEDGLEEAAERPSASASGSALEASLERLESLLGLRSADGASTAPLAVDVPSVDEIAGAVQAGLANSLFAQLGRLSYRSAGILARALRGGSELQSQRGGRGHQPRGAELGPLLGAVKVDASADPVQAHAQARLWQAVAQHAVDVISDAKAAVGGKKNKGGTTAASSGEGRAAAVGGAAVGGAAVNGDGGGFPGAAAPGSTFRDFFARKFLSGFEEELEAMRQPGASGGSEQATAELLLECIKGLGEVAYPTAEDRELLV